jgi:hypothetical protein
MDAVAALASAAADIASRYTTNKSIIIIIIIILFLLASPASSIYILSSAVGHFMLLPSFLSFPSRRVFSASWQSRVWVEPGHDRIAASEEAVVQNDEGNKLLNVDELPRFTRLCGVVQLFIFSFAELPLCSFRVVMHSHICVSFFAAGHFLHFPR